MNLFWQIMYALVTVLCIAVLPFAIFYYEVHNTHTPTPAHIVFVRIFNHTSFIDLLLLSDQLSTTPDPNPGRRRPDGE